MIVAMSFVLLRRRNSAWETRFSNSSVRELQVSQYLQNTYKPWWILRIQVYQSTLIRDHSFYQWHIWKAWSPLLALLSFWSSLSFKNSPLIQIFNPIDTFFQRKAAMFEYIYALDLSLLSAFCMFKIRGTRCIAWCRWGPDMCHWDRYCVAS